MIYTIIVQPLDENLLCNVNLDETERSSKLKKRKRPYRVDERNVFNRYDLSPSERCCKRSVSVEDTLTNSGCSIPNLSSISRSSFGSSYLHSINCNGDRINIASFKKNFAASCLPSSVWRNHSLPNLSLSSSHPYTPYSFFAFDFPALSHFSSVEYFIPERNFVPKCGAYCVWSSSPSDDESTKGKDTFFLQPKEKYIPFS